MSKKKIFDKRRKWCSERLDCLYVSRCNFSNDHPFSLAEQITVRRRYDRGRLQKSVVELVVEKSDIAHLQDWKGFICNGYERAARQRRLAHAATCWRKGEFIQVITTNSATTALLHSNEAKMNFNPSIVAITVTNFETQSFMYCQPNYTYIYIKHMFLLINTVSHLFCVRKTHIIAYVKGT